jgi:dTDP-4-amino-4,6-dideoxygalactose transaminase
MRARRTERNTRAGRPGRYAGCFSFYPGKNLGAYGEAGAVVTNNVELAQKIRVFRDHGQVKKYDHAMIGWNARMDGIQGAVLSVKLGHLPAWNEARRSHAKLYYQLLAGVQEVIFSRVADHIKHIYHIFPIRVKSRDALIATLAERGIQCGVHYPVPIHLQSAFRSWARQGDVPCC